MGPASHGVALGAIDRGYSVPYRFLASGRETRSDPEDEENTVPPRRPAHPDSPHHADRDAPRHLPHRRACTRYRRTAMETVSRLGVVGCGLMGSGIAEVAARHGLDVLVAEATHDAAETGRRRLTASLDRALQRGKLTEEERDQALARLKFTCHLNDLADRQFVIEAVAEQLDIKIAVIQALDKEVVDPRAILATNTSSFPIVDLA